MNVNELGDILNRMYMNSQDGEKVAMIHLFGIKYANEIKSIDSSSREIAKAAKINDSYSTEISKGVKLAKYVNVK